MIKYVVSFMRLGYIAEMTKEEYDNLNEDEKKDAWVISMTEWSVYTTEDVKAKYPEEFKKFENKKFDIRKYKKL